MREDPKQSVSDPELKSLFEKVVLSAIKTGRVENSAYGIKATCDKDGDGLYFIEYDINHKEVRKALNTPLATASKMCYFWLMGVEIYKDKDNKVSIHIDGREHKPEDKPPRFNISDTDKWTFQRVAWR